MMSNYINKIHILKENILSVKNELFQKTAIRRHSPPDGVIYLGNLNRWGATDSKLQMELLKLYNSYFEKVSLLLCHASENDRKKIEASNNSIINLIEQKPRKAPASSESAIRIINDNFKVFDNYLELLSSTSNQIILIPDTNSLLIQPEPIKYSTLIGTNEFIFLLTPTVLSELDKLKMFHRDENFRKKAKSVIRRIKGYRNQGDILFGVTLNKTVRLKMIAIEPNFKNTLEWLDENNMDDRIIATALETQINNPSDTVAIVTADINLQNKAELASLEFYDTDDL